MFVAVLLPLLQISRVAWRTARLVVATVRDPGAGDVVLPRHLDVYRFRGTLAVDEMLRTPGLLLPLPACLAAGDWSPTRMPAHFIFRDSHVLELVSLPPPEAALRSRRSSLHLLFSLFCSFDVL